MTDRLDDLLLLEKLAAGGMAEVYRAVQQGYGGFEKTVAVKRILPHYASDEEFKNMFVLEANLSGMFVHSNIVQVYSNGESDGYLYLVMEFVDGRNVRQLLAKCDKLKKRIPIEYACYIIAEAAKGLDYAHSFLDPKTGDPMNIVHRDMSPQNIMLSYDGSVKIVDFGIAKAAARSEHTRAGVLKGKFGYMSPEQANGMSIDKRTDIFALGIIFFELLTQRRLFSHDDDMRTLQLVRECRTPRPSKYNPAINPALDRIVSKALAKNRNDRYSSAGEMYSDLQKFLNQKYPDFLSTNLAGFLRTEVFDADIEKDKKKRELLAADAPARLGNPKVKRNHIQGDHKQAVVADKDATQIEDMGSEDSEVTTLSEVSRVDGELPEAGIGILSASLDEPKELFVESSDQAAESSSKNEKKKVVAKKSAGSPDFDEKSSESENTRITCSQVMDKAMDSEEEIPPEVSPKKDFSSSEVELSVADFEDDSLPKPASSDNAKSQSSSEMKLSLSIGSSSDRTKVSSRPSLGNAPNKVSDDSDMDTLQLSGVSLMKQTQDSAYSVQSPMDSDDESEDLGKISFAESDHALARVIRNPLFIGTFILAIGGALLQGESTDEPAARLAKEAVESGKKMLVSGEAALRDAAEGKLAANSETEKLKESESGRLPASAGVDGTYQPQGATGFLEVVSFPRATKVYVNGELLSSDGSGRAPAGLKNIEVGTQNIRLENEALGMSWEGEVEIVFDSVKKLEVRLK